MHLNLICHALSGKEQRISPIILQIKNISKEYKSSNLITQTIFDGMDLEIREGGFVTIIGKSGCGKVLCLILLRVLTNHLVEML